jgi:Cu/Ag efflux protein CusF
MPLQPKTIAATIAAVLLVGATSPAVVVAQTELPAAVGEVSSQLSGKVMVVNTETRLMTLKDAEGTFHVLHVPPEVTRLDKIKIGDQVTISELSSVLIELVPQSEAGPAAAVVTTEIDRDAGKKPGGTITETLTLSGKIVGLNKKAGEVTIKGPNATRTFNVEDTAMLDGVKVGDGVVARFRNEIIGEVR